MEVSGSSVSGGFKETREAPMHATILNPIVFLRGVAVPYKQWLVSGRFVPRMEDSRWGDDDDTANGVEKPSARPSALNRCT